MRRIGIRGNTRHEGTEVPQYTPEFEGPFARADRLRSEAQARRDELHAARLDVTHASYDAMRQELARRDLHTVYAIERWTPVDQNACDLFEDELDIVWEHSEAGWHWDYASAVQAIELLAQEPAHKGYGPNEAPAGTPQDIGTYFTIEKRYVHTSGAPHNGPQPERIAHTATARAIIPDWTSEASPREQAVRDNISLRAAGIYTSFPP
jgi:hypothetical protein